MKIKEKEGKIKRDIQRKIEIEREGEKERKKEINRVREVKVCDNTYRCNTEKEVHNIVSSYSNSPFSVRVVEGRGAGVGDSSRSFAEHTFGKRISQPHIKSRSSIIALNHHNISAFLSSQC